MRLLRDRENENFNVVPWGRTPLPKPPEGYEWMQEALYWHHLRSIDRGIIIWMAYFNGLGICAGFMNERGFLLESLDELDTVLTVLLAKRRVTGD